MLERLFDFSKLGGDYAELITSARKGIPCSVLGMGLEGRVLSSVSLGGNVLYITSDYISAKRTEELFTQVLGASRVCLFPSGSDVFTLKKAQSGENNIERIKTIYKLICGEAKVIVASIDALFGLVPNRKDFYENILNIKLKDEINLSNLQKQFIKMGYTKEALVGEVGQFSVRGDIIDVFPINNKFPCRIELFGDTVDTIKLFDPSTQKSREELTFSEICPSTNIFLNEEQEQELRAKLKTCYDTDLDDINANARLHQILDEVTLRLDTKNINFTMDFLFPLIEKNMSSLLDYLEQGTTIVFDECKIVFDGGNSFFSEVKERRKMLEKAGETFPSGGLGYVNKTELYAGFLRFNLIAHQKITTNNNFFKPAAVFSFRTVPVSRYTHNLGEFAKDVKNWILSGFKVFIMAKDEKNAKQICGTLEDKDIYLDIKHHAAISDNYSAILPVEFTSGFVLPLAKVVVIGTYDILPKKQKTTHVMAGRKDVFSVPKIGDFVVHAVHGIGVCEGVTKLTGNFGTKDFIVVKYRDNDTLYVPIDQMDMLDRFSGADTPKRLSKIGGADFALIKERVKKAIREMAIDLLSLYAERETKKGYAFPKDNITQMEFENSFAYTETEDQLISLSEIKKDMQSSKVMDRLLCGDVGFGKTEVALRAAFKAILGGKQVAFLAPTTILSEQHYNTARARFDSFGVNCACINRFKTDKEKKEILRDLKYGKTDLICGTHRLLSKDVEFKDLGLIILDEEQKFGVEDKEKIKLKNSTVDVLTLSATPIPRTLHMSLSGIRDVSIISTPPSDRFPIQTYVTEYSETIVKDAIEREMARGGQVFFVFNRIDKIYAFASQIEKLVPGARVVVGHGQLAGTELEGVVYKFYNKMADVLICTTIIENGIDMGNANTLIVYDSDRFGLSQLYQIRGRVGRSNRMAYAYFMYKEDKILTEEAYKRLEAISEFTEFGSGFKIAMRDLEIRGSGNVLGAEQHGHMQKVGYDMYLKLLNNAVAELKGKKIREENEVVMKVGLDAFISDKYITDSENRMTVYKNISHIASEKDKLKIQEELTDMFGKIPSETKNLIDIAYAKSLARGMGITEVLCNSDSAKLIFEKDSSIVASESIANAIYKYAKYCVLNLGALPTISFNFTGKTTLESFNILQDFLCVAFNLYKK